MTCYIVRRRKKHSLLGLYAATSLANLWDQVDEIADPPDYEWRKIKNGGIYFPNDEPSDLSKIEDEDKMHKTAEAEDKLHATTTELLFHRWQDGKSKKWTRFDFANEGVGLIARIMADVNKPE